MSSAISARLWFYSRMRHNAFRKPELRIFRHPYHFIGASQWDGNLFQKFGNICFCFKSVSKVWKVSKVWNKKGTFEYDAYKQYRNALNRTIKAAKQNYYEQQILLHKNDPKKLWKTIHSILEINPKSKSSIESVTRRPIDASIQRVYLLGFKELSFNILETRK